MTTETVENVTHVKKGKPVSPFQRTGLFSLGLSFSAWAIISVLYSTNAFFLDSPVLTFLSLLSVGLTALGLLAASFTWHWLRAPGKYFSIVSVAVFVCFNLIGLFSLLFFTVDQTNGPFGITWNGFYSLYEQTAIFIAYLTIFVLTLYPYMANKARWGLLIPIVMACLYLALTIHSNLVLLGQHSGVTPEPVAILPVAVPQLAQLFSPIYGIPGALLDNVFMNFVPGYAVFFSAAANASFAVLYFYTARAFPAKDQLVQIYGKSRIQ